MKRYSCALSLLVVLATVASGQIIYNNGPFVSHVGGGFGGADASAITAPGTTFGFTSSAALRLADDFTVPAGEVWTINSFRVYGYNTQTVFTTTSTLTAANYRIWSGPPPAAGSTILYDFSAVSQMTSTGFASNCYRVTATTLTNQARPMFNADMSGNSISLGAGTYWFDFQLAGSIAPPTAAATFTPSITIVGQNVTGNAMQFNGTLWVQALLDGGAPQGLPFQIDHSTAQAPGFMVLSISQPGGPGGPVFLSDTNGVAGNTFVNVATLAPGAFPNGWLFGVDISVPELLGELNGGLPFIGTLDGLGSFLLPPVALGLPFPITVYYVGVQLSGATVVNADAAKSVTILP